MRQRISIIASGIAVALVAAAGGYLAGRGHGAVADKGTASAPQAASGPGPTGERKVLYWHDPMVPGARFDKPGKSPFMDMQLVPVYADASTDGGVKVSAATQQSLGVRTAAVRRADTARAIDAVGSVQFDERLMVAVQARVAGYVEHLAVRATMEQVRRGQALATIFAPDWLGPLNELLALERANAPADLVAAARDRLRALSIPDALVKRSEQSGTAQARFTLDAPESGVVAELGVREGAAIAPGSTLFRLAGLGTVWAVADVPEAQLGQLKVGQKVTARLEANGEAHFEGTLAELLPQINPATRTLQARFEVANPAGRLVPGMLLRMRIDGPAANGLVVPAEAVIRTGTRAAVIVQDDAGGFAPRDVTLGREIGDDIEVTAGLREGERIVASGQFLIDSEANLRSAAARLAGADAAPTPASHAVMPPDHPSDGGPRTGGAR